jgi:FHA domain/Domain of unknown function (DUF4388)
MQVILQGSLRHFAAAELLSFLCHPERKGTLDLETQGRRTRILFSGEHIVWAESKNAPEPMDALLDVLSWTAGTFTLLDSLELPPYAQPLSLTLGALHEEVKRRAEQGTYGDDTLFRIVQNPAQEQVSLTGEEFKILFRLSTGRTLGELVTDLGADRNELTERLKKLEELGLIESGTEQQQQAAAPEIPTNPFAKTLAGEMPIVAPPTEPIPVQEDAEVTRVERATLERRTQAPKTVARKKTMVGSLTPDDSPDAVHPLLDAEVVIGRAPGSGITIPDGSVSSQHAKIRRTEDGFVLEDLKSRNGTFVNGEKVEQPRLLLDGDLVRIGKIIMTFNVAQEEKSTPKTEPEIRL